MHVVLDFGLWSRAERDELRRRARALGVGVELHLLTAPVDELWRRIDERNAVPPWSAAPIARSVLDAWAAAFEAPDAAELTRFDAPPPGPGSDTSARSDPSGAAASPTAKRTTRARFRSQPDGQAGDLEGTFADRGPTTERARQQERRADADRERDR